VVAFFAMPERGHLQLLLPLVSALTARGLAASVWTDRRFKSDVDAAGAEFVDLFGRYPLDEADAESSPFPCRYVSFAGAYADQVSGELEKRGPQLVVYETFAVIGRVAARLLGLPYVNVSAGHNMDPARFLPQLEADPRVAISADCERAVAALKGRHGIDDATPFSYISGLSPYLNVLCEPEPFLTESERRAFEPSACFGSLPSEPPDERGGGWFGGHPETLKVYVSFGTVVWRYWVTEALDALGAIAGAVAREPGVRAVLDLKGAPGRVDVTHLRKPNVTVSSEVDQKAILQEADLFVTHHGLNSTHEAIFNRVPMISYPFFSDQPGLAQKCRRFGLAIPLTARPRERVTEDHVRAAFAEFEEGRESMAAALERAREWELEAIAGRDAVVRRVTDLIDS